MTYPLAPLTSPDGTTTRRPVDANDQVRLTYDGWRPAKIAPTSTTDAPVEVAPEPEQPPRLRSKP